MTRRHFLTVLLTVVFGWGRATKRRGAGFVRRFGRATSGGKYPGPVEPLDRQRILRRAEWSG